MGEVYRARDSELEREVAIKVLPAAFADDEERVARLEREARLLASLNHPHIAAIHSLEAVDGNRFLVLEVVEGETLQERIARGPLPLDEAIEVSRQIAEALDAAHGKGVIHRDLKPPNIKLAPEGGVKVLDFGLAKQSTPEPSSSQSESPTFTRYTETGVILGTAPYMSPEQARGKHVDKRTDVWAFGCVLYEMLTGRNAFRGDDVSATLAQILEREPDWSALPARTPASVRRLLTRCLQKDPKRRLRDVGTRSWSSTQSRHPAKLRRTQVRLGGGASYGARWVFWLGSWSRRGPDRARRVWGPMPRCGWRDFIPSPSPRTCQQRLSHCPPMAHDWSI